MTDSIAHIAENIFHLALPRFFHLYPRLRKAILSQCVLGPMNYSFLIREEEIVDPVKWNEDEEAPQNG